MLHLLTSAVQERMQRMEVKKYSRRKTNQTMILQQKSNIQMMKTIKEKMNIQSFVEEAAFLAK